ncbi:MAG: DUF2520 domain-containing protein [Deltaproteobacteria bacterium]|nr:DUF2520 domain-containing protein [Deltaproteobacteria bacterium]
MTRTQLRVLVLGRGKVGSALGRALRAAGLAVSCRGRRDGWPRGPIEAQAVILALPDAEIGVAARALAHGGRLGARGCTALLHCAGGLGPEVLAPARGPRVAVAQMHPLVSFASARHPPSLGGAYLLVDGDPPAARLARALGRRLGMRPFTPAALDRTLYHAAASLAAGGAAALGAAGVELLEAAGIDSPRAAAMLGALLRTVADNVARLGLPAALTGPVRRGDDAILGRHLDAVGRRVPQWLPLYAALGRAQLRLARKLGEAPARSLAQMARALHEGK